MKKTFGVWKTTILGGVFFLLPFAVVVFLVGQLSVLVMPIAAEMQKRGVLLSFGRVSGATVLAIVLLIVFCYLAGLAARSTFASGLSTKIEKTIVLLFPRYAILKDQIASNVGGHETVAPMKPVVIRLDDLARVGFETNRTADGRVTVFLPGSPDPWQGHIVLVAADRVESLAGDFNALVTMCESLGRTSAVGTIPV